MKNEKKVTQEWNEENVTHLLELYDNGEGESVATIAAELGVTVPRVRGKLVAEGVYVKQAPKAVGGASPVRKIQIVQQIAEKTGIGMDVLESLEKGNKNALEALSEYLSK